jgi:hypothetical protein
MDARRDVDGLSKLDLLDDDVEDDLALKVFIDNLEMETKLLVRGVAGDSRLRKRPAVDRKHQVGHESVFNDYFVKYPIYSPNSLRSFEDAIECNAPYF